MRTEASPIVDKKRASHWEAKAEIFFQNFLFRRKSRPLRAHKCVAAQWAELSDLHQDRVVMVVVGHVDLVIRLLRLVHDDASDVPCLAAHH